MSKERWLLLSYPAQVGIPLFLRAFGLFPPPSNDTGVEPVIYTMEFALIETAEVVVETTHYRV